jgi:hypothetical protein
MSGGSIPIRSKSVPRPSPFAPPRTEIVSRLAAIGSDTCGAPLIDPQPSGGLLVGCHAKQAVCGLTALRRGVASIVGIVERGEAAIRFESAG